MYQISAIHFKITDEDKDINQNKFVNNFNMRNAPKVMPHVLIQWSTTKANGGGMAVQIVPSNQLYIIF